MLCEDDEPGRREAFVRPQELGHRWNEILWETELNALRSKPEYVENIVRIDDVGKVKKDHFNGEYSNINSVEKQASVNNNENTLPPIPEPLFDINRFVDFWIDGLKVENLKRKIVQRISQNCRNAYVTTFEIISAILILIALCTNQEERKYYQYETTKTEIKCRLPLGTIVNLRGIASDLPDNYFGNAVFTIDIEIPLKLLNFSIINVQAQKSKNYDYAFASETKHILYSTTDVEIEDLIGTIAQQIHHSLEKFKDKETMDESAKILNTLRRRGEKWAYVIPGITLAKKGIILNSWNKNNWLDLKFGSTFQAKGLFLDPSGNLLYDNKLILPFANDGFFVSQQCRTFKEIELIESFLRKWQLPISLLTDV
eukprot:Awhi_evm1s9648